LSSGARFWLADLEPLGGRLRFVFYAGLLALLLTGTYRSPAFAAKAFLWTDPDLYTPVGVFSWIGVSWASETGLHALAAIGVLALSCTALGLGRSVMPWIGAACFFVLYGVIQGAVGVTHRWHLPIYALCALCVARADDGFSLDEWLADRVPGYPRQTGPALFHTGFARKLVLLFAVATLFSGFAAKLIESGFVWADGHTLQFDIARSHARWDWLANQITGHLWLAQLLGIATLLIEGLSPLALFSRRARHALIPCALGFHVGIMLVMSPRYFPQMWCYVLLVDWGAAGSWLRDRRWKRSGSQLEAALSPRASGAAQLLGSAIALGLLSVALVRIEFWPLTHIPMYSAYRGPAHTLEHFRDEAQLREHASNCVEDTLCMGSSRWIAIEIVARDGARDRLTGLARIDPRRRKTGAHSKQLWPVLRTLTARIVVSRTEGALAFAPDAPLSEAERELLAMLPALQRSISDWERYERLEITLRLATGDILLTSLALAP
jgi:hypothetical protein